MTPLKLFACSARTLIALSVAVAFTSTPTVFANEATEHTLSQQNQHNQQNAKMDADRAEQGYYRDHQSVKEHGGVGNYIPREWRKVQKKFEERQARAGERDKGLYLSHDDVMQKGGVGNYVTRDKDKKTEAIAKKESTPAPVAEASQPEQPVTPPATTAQTEPTIAAPSETVPDGLLLSLKNELYFETDRAELRTQAEAPLAEMGRYLSTYPEKQVRVDGYADATGDDHYNVELSRRRAERVAKFLMDHGAQAHQVMSLGQGESHPVATNRSDEGRALNRRVEVSVEGESSV